MPIWSASMYSWRINGESTWEFWWPNANLDCFSNIIRWLAWEMFGEVHGLVWDRCHNGWSFIFCMELIISSSTRWILMRKELLIYMSHTFRVEWRQEFTSTNKDERVLEAGDVWSPLNGHGDKRQVGKWALLGNLYKSTRLTGISTICK